MSRPAPDRPPAAPQRCRPATEAALRADPVVWLSSVQTDGRPHLVPVWFHWDGEQIVAFSKPHARKVENLPDSLAADLMPAEFGAKYRELLRRAGLTVQRFAAVYSQPIVLRPTRFLGYGGRGWSGTAVAT